jgi:hypothetical protein
VKEDPLFVSITLIVTWFSICLGKKISAMSLPDIRKLMFSDISKIKIKIQP